MSLHRSIVQTLNKVDVTLVIFIALMHNNTLPLRRFRRTLDIQAIYYKDYETHIDESIVDICHHDLDFERIWTITCYGRLIDI